MDQLGNASDNDAVLAGSVTDDGLPGGTITGRSKLTGPGVASFADPASTATDVSFDAPGTYVLRLTASDGALAAADDVVVTVGRDAAGPPPAVSLASPPERRHQRADRRAGQRGEYGPPRLEARAPVGARALDRFASGTTPTSNAVLGQLDPTLLMNGITEVRLTVTDNAGRAAQATTHVVVKDQQKVGNFTVSFVDLEVPGRRPAHPRDALVRLARQAAGRLRLGWRLELSDVRVEESRDAGPRLAGTEPGLLHDLLPAAHGRRGDADAAGRPRPSSGARLPDDVVARRPASRSCRSTTCA